MTWRSWQGLGSRAGGRVIGRGPRVGKGPPRAGGTAVSISVAPPRPHLLPTPLRRRGLCPWSNRGCELHASWTGVLNSFLGVSHRDAGGCSVHRHSRGTKELLMDGAEGAPGRGRLGPVGEECRGGAPPPSHLLLHLWVTGSRKTQAGGCLMLTSRSPSVAVLSGWVASPLGAMPPPTP